MIYFKGISNFLFFFFSLTGDLQLGKVIGWDLLGLVTSTRFRGYCWITVLHNYKISQSEECLNTSPIFSKTSDEVGKISTVYD